jgi:hypothetical protein
MSSAGRKARSKTLTIFIDYSRPTRYASFAEPKILHMTSQLTVAFAISLLGIVLPLSAEQALPQPFTETSTERVNFTPHGTIRFVNSFGYLDIEAWDEPAVEVTVIKSTDSYYEPARKEQAVGRLNRVRVAADRRSDTELAITTTVPKRGGLPLVTKAHGGVNLEYRIRVPRDSKLVIRHGSGDIMISGVADDIDAHSSSGDLIVLLPPQQAYAIDAKTVLGTVTSDFAGTAHHRRLIGEGFANAGATAGKRIHLRVGRGGITIKQVPLEKKSF